MRTRETCSLVHLKDTIRQPKNIRTQLSLDNLHFLQEDVNMLNGRRIGEHFHQHSLNINRLRFHQ